MISWLESLSRPGPAAFLALFFLEAVGRTLLIAVIPLQALDILGDARNVSVLYFGASLAGLLFSFAIPWLIRNIRRRGVVALGAGANFAAAALLATETANGLAMGLWLHIVGTACLEVPFNLYVLDYVRRKELGRFEPNRIFAAATGWTICPALGVALRAHLAPWAPFAASAAVTVILLLYFRKMRGTDEPPRPPVVPANPLRYVIRFFAQPRLRLAWSLAAGRASWWMLFFVYAPIYAVATDLGEVAGGTIVSAGGAALFLTILWGWMARRFGMRPMLIAGHAGTAVLTALVAAAGGEPLIGAYLLVGAALAASVIDGVGNSTFLRAVRPLERAEMTTVFNTFRHVAQIVTPGVFAVLLDAFDLTAVFLTGGVLMAALAALSVYIPRRM